MADVGEIWQRARRDRGYRELLDRDPATALAGLGLTDDELALLDAALRATRPSGVRALFAVPTEPAVPPSATPHPSTGGDLPTGRKDPS